jgi:hypothetical protein
MADQAMARKEISPLYQYWKAPTVMDRDIATYHEVGCLSRVLLCTPYYLGFLDDRLNQHRLFRVASVV